MRSPRSRCRRRARVSCSCRPRSRWRSRRRGTRRSRSSRRLLPPRSRSRSSTRRTPSSSGSRSPDSSSSGWLWAHRDGRAGALALTALVLPAAGFFAWLLPVIGDTASVSPGGVERERGFEKYAGQLDGSVDRFSVTPELFVRTGAIAVAALLLIPLAGLATTRRWAAWVVGGSLAVFVVCLVPWIFTPFSDAVSLSQSRRLAGFLPLAFALAGGMGVLARLLGPFVVPARPRRAASSSSSSIPGTSATRSRTAVRRGQPGRRRRRRRRARRRPLQAAAARAHGRARLLPPPAADLRPRDRELEPVQLAAADHLLGRAPRRGSRARAGRRGRLLLAGAQLSTRCLRADPGVPQPEEPRRRHDRQPTPRARPRVPPLQAHRRPLDPARLRRAPGSSSTRSGSGSSPTSRRCTATRGGSCTGCETVSGASNVTRKPSTRRAVATVALVALAAVLVVQASGPNQAAHFALVRALADGTAEIDPRETIDAAYVDGRFYAAKAPGLALYDASLVRGPSRGRAPGRRPRDRDRVSRPALGGQPLRRGASLPRPAPARPRGSRARRCRATGCRRPSCSASERCFCPSRRSSSITCSPRCSASPRSSSCSRRAATRLRGGAPAVAGLLAGLAIVAEFPLALVTAVLAGYAALGASPVRRLGAYLAGAARRRRAAARLQHMGLGSPFRLSYTNALEAPVGDGTTPVVGANDEGFYGVGLPDPRAALSLLVSEKGLLVVSPLVLAALAGLPLLWRSGRRAEALVCGSVPLAFLAYNAAYYLPFGGQGPGPRFLVPALPFLALPLGNGASRAAARRDGRRRRVRLRDGARDAHGAADGSRVRHRHLARPAARRRPRGDGHGPARVRARGSRPHAFCCSSRSRLPSPSGACRSVSAVGRKARCSQPCWLPGSLSRWRRPELLPADAENGTPEGAVAVAAGSSRSP